MIELVREQNAERINALINRPDVRPWIAPGTEPVDISKTVADVNNVLLMGQHGGCMFFKLMQGIYEAHTQVEADARGPWTDELTAAAVNWMFLKTDCYEIVTRVPEGHVAARAAAQRRGMRFEFTRPKECLFKDRKVDVHIYSFRLPDWIGQAEHLEAVGQQFHELLHAAAMRYGVAEQRHEDDPNHNRYVGAALEMARQGHPRKGVLWYNRWALASRHAPVALLKDANPVTIRIDSGFVVTIVDGTVEVHHAMA